MIENVDTKVLCEYKLGSAFMSIDNSYTALESGSVNEAPSPFEFSMTPDSQAPWRCVVCLHTEGSGEGGHLHAVAMRKRCARWHAGDAMGHSCVKTMA